MTASESCLSVIIEKLTHYQMVVSSRANLARTDVNKGAEHFLKPILNITYGLNLRSIKKINNAGIDLADENKKIAYQITSTPTSEKANKMLEQCVKHGLNEKFEIIRLFVLTKKQSKYRFKEEDANLLSFTTSNIYDFNDLFSEIEHQTNLDQKQRIVQHIQRELPSAEAKIMGKYVRYFLGKYSSRVLLPILILAGFLLWNNNNKEGASIVDIPSDTSSPIQLKQLKVIVLPFLGDKEVNIQQIIVSTLRDKISFDSLDIQVDTATYQNLSLGEDTMINRLSRKYKADMVIWGEYSRAGKGDYYKVKYKTSRWPGLKNPITHYVPFDVENVSSGNIDGNVTYVIKYLEALINYTSIAELPSQYSSSDKGYPEVAIKVKRATRLFTELLTDNPVPRLKDSLNVYLANSHQFLFEDSTAIVYYLRYIESVPQDANALNSLSALYAKNKQYTLADKYIDKAILFSNRSADFVFNKGFFQYLNNRCESAIPLFQEILPSEYGDKGYYYIARCEIRQNKLEKALFYLEQSIKKRAGPDNELLRARVFAGLGQHRKAFEAYKIAARWSGQTESCLLASMQMLYLLKNYDDVAEIASNCIRRYPKNHKFYMIRAIAKYEMRQFNNSLHDFSFALSIEKKDPALFYNRSQVYHIQGNFDAFRADSSQYELLMKDTQNDLRDLYKYNATYVDVALPEPEY